MAPDLANGNSDCDAPGSSTSELRTALQAVRRQQIELEAVQEELRATQAKLSAEQARYIDLYDLAPVGFLTVSQEAVILQANLSAAALVGLPRDSLIGMTLPDFMFPSDAANCRLLCQGTLRGGETLSYELRIRRPEGQAVWMTLQAVAITGDDGHTAVRMVLSDITARKRVEKTLLINTRLRNAILDSVPAQIAVLDPTGLILAVNAGWRVFALENGLAEAAGSEVGANYLEVCRTAIAGSSLEDAQRAHDGILAVINGTLPSFELEYACHLPLRQRWFSMTVTPLHVDNHAVVVTHTDITMRRQLEQAARNESESRFLLVADNVFDGILIVSADHRIEYVSPAYAEQLGYADADEIRRDPQGLFAQVHPEDFAALLAGLQGAVDAGEHSKIYTYRIRHRLGHYLWRESSAKFQYDAAGKLLRTCIVARDITRRKTAELIQRIAAVAFDSQQPSVIADANMVVTRVNPAFTVSTGYTPQEIVGQPLDILRSNRHSPEFFTQIWDSARLLGSWQGEVWDRHKDGRVVPKSLTISAVRGQDGVISHYVGSAFDLSERKQAEVAMLKMNQSLTQSRQQLRKLVALNDKRIEYERQHMAREVHDELGQVLTALHMDLSLASINYGKQTGALKAELNGMKEQVDRAIQAVRSVSTRLRPAALDMGLVPSISWLCGDFSRRGDVQCVFTASDEAIELDPGRATVIFRIVQESLTNISRYAHASRVSVQLALAGNALSLLVQDNGVGFDLEAAARRGSLGLLGMRERALAIGGTVEVDSQPGQGTRVSVSIPLADDTDREPE